MCISSDSEVECSVDCAWCSPFTPIMSGAAAAAALLLLLLLLLLVPFVAFAANDVVCFWLPFVATAVGCFWCRLLMLLPMMTFACGCRSLPLLSFAFGLLPLPMLMHVAVCQRQGRHPTNPSSSSSLLESTMGTSLAAISNRGLGSSEQQWRRTAVASSNPPGNGHPTRPAAAHRSRRSTAALHCCCGCRCCRCCRCCHC